MTVKCQNTNCKYRSANNFCTKELVPLNRWGCCKHWWLSDQLQARADMWDYAEGPVKEPEAEPNAAE